MRLSQSAIISGTMELHQLNTFVAVAEEGSFTRAADRLHVVQSAVSASVRKLERELGVTLFDRTTHRVALSDAGRVLLPEARATLAAAAGAREAIEQLRGGLRGTVSLGTMQGQAMRAIGIAAVLADFRATHPGVEVRVGHGGGSAYMADAVRDGRLDLAVVSLPDRRPPGLTRILLASEAIALAVSPAHPLARRRSVALTALRDEPFVDLPPGWGTRMTVDRACAAAGIERTIAYEVNDTAAVAEFVAHGLAVALMPPSHSVAAAGELAFVPLRGRAPRFETALISSAERRVGAAARALAETIERVAAAHARQAAALAFWCR